MNYHQRRNQRAFKQCQANYDGAEHPDYYRSDYEDEGIEEKEETVYFVNEIRYPVARKAYISDEKEVIEIGEQYEYHFKYGYDRTVKGGEEEYSYFKIVSRIKLKRDLTPFQIALTKSLNKKGRDY